MFKKIITLGLAIVMCLGILTACIDYGYEFHFSVVGENGTLSAGWWDINEVWHDKPSPVSLKGNKSGQRIELIAMPNEGYQVKEWICDGKVVEDNKSNSYTAIAVDSKHYKVTVTVEFEPIPNE